MQALLAINHLLNFVAPAFVVALLVVCCAHVFQRQRARGRGWLWPVAINFFVGCLALVLGLWVFGNDGMLATYGALIVAIATTHWALLRGWSD